MSNNGRSNNGSKTTKNEGVDRAHRPEYQPTAREQQALRKQIQRLEAEPAAPRFKVTKSGTARVLSVDHPDEAVGARLVAEALGSVSEDFVRGTVAQIMKAISGDSQVVEREINFAVDVVKGVKPRDQVEAMLATQMALVHMAATKLAGHLAADNMPRQDKAELALKCMRTFTTQVETLKRYRSGGEQTVTVQHVSVTDGGKAIVGNVMQAPRPSKPQQPVNTARALTDKRQPPMAFTNELQGEVVPLKARAKR
jgi:hypothetical protein